MNTWFRHRAVDDGLIHIDDNARDSIFLYIGDTGDTGGDAVRTAVLIDTGFGLADLRGLVESLTDKPVRVFNTHGHIDHMCGNYQFAECRMHPADMPMCSGPIEQGVVDFIRDRILREGFPAGFDRRAWRKRTVPPIPLDPSGYEFGKLRVSVLHTPGHTPGSVAFRIDPPGYVFVGDTIVHGPTWLHLEESEPVTSFLYSVKALAGFARGAKGIYCSHSPDPIPPRIIEAFPSFVERVVSGDIAGRHMQTFAGEGLVFYLEEPYGVLLPTQIGA